MSFIAVTFGYNQFSIFNTKTSTQTLIDKIKEISLLEIKNTLKARDGALQKEIDQSVTEEENLKKIIKSSENELKVEEEKEAQIKRLAEEAAKKEEKQIDSKKKKTKVTPQKKEKEKEKKKETETENHIITDLKAKIETLNANLQNITNERGIYSEKKKKLGEIMKMNYKEWGKRNIDLIDAKGERVHLDLKGNCLANEYLTEHSVYELATLVEGEDKENIIAEPMKYDGFCMRSIEEDAKYEEMEKTGGKGKKQDKKKK